MTVPQQSCAWIVRWSNLLPQQKIAEAQHQHTTQRAWAFNSNDNGARYGSHFTPKFIYRFEETQDESHPWEGRLLQAAAARLGVSPPQVVPAPPQGRAAEASSLLGTNHRGGQAGLGGQPGALLTSAPAGLTRLDLGSTCSNPSTLAFIL